MTKLNRDDNGKLIRYAFPGGYRIVYVDGHGDTLCHACASFFDTEREGMCAGWARPITSFILWEGDSLECVECGEVMPSEYGGADD